MKIKGLDKCCIAIPDPDEVLQAGALNEMSCRKKWKPDGTGVNILFFEPNVHAFTYLRNLFPDATYDAPAEQHREKCREQIRKTNFLLTEKTKELGQLQDINFEGVFKTEPFEHQLKILRLSCLLPYYALFCEQGTGKTKIVIDNVAYLKMLGQIEALFILTLNGVHANWVKEELPTHMSDNVPYEAALWYSTPRADEKKQLLNVCETPYNGKLKVLAMNIDAVNHERGYEYVQAFLQKHRCFFTMDEGLLIKTPGSGRTKATLQLGKLAPFKRLLNGTPITQGMEDLYAQFSFLSESILGFSSYYTFKNQHCVIDTNQTRTNRSYDLVVGYKNVDELLRKVDAFSYRVTKEECLDLPERTYRKRFVRLTPAQRKWYDAVKEELVVKITRDKTLTVKNVLSEMVRLRQIVGGFLPTDDGELLAIDDTPPKLTLLLEEIALNKTYQGIIWAAFTAEVDLIASKLKVPTYQGSTPRDIKEAMKVDFQAGNLQWFVATSPNQPTGAGIGITLNKARSVYHYSNVYSYAMRCQMDDRAHRSGQLNKVTYTDLVAQDTIDEPIIKALRSKRELASAVTKDELLAWL